PLPAEPKYLISDTLNARLELRNGAIIGRKTGDYINVFGNQDYVSRTHARLQKNDAGDWEIVDLDSANGTFLNEQQLTPNQPAAFQIGDTITFYNIKFLVSG
ncbi:MAG: FHA domain-containing protein, partial [Leptospirales bacterium]|nr:FHA domain-containing protein [Leptospirales bacterium]